ncbi:MAG: hypothetical protein HY815_30760 [Candidatus Riflebacteria bacterium]|nr:hypothetical protein [Candidatus Riflebacteria bacterium]
MKLFLGPVTGLVIVATLMPGALLAGPRGLLRSLPERSMVTVGEGVRVAALFAGLSKGELDAAAAHKALVEARLLEPTVATSFGSTLKRGLASYLFFRAMRMKGGWVCRVFGPSPRYAYKEFVCRQLVLAEGENTPIPGGELLSMLKLSSDLRRSGGAR